MTFRSQNWLRQWFADPFGNKRQERCSARKPVAPLPHNRNNRTETWAILGEFLYFA